VKKNYTTKIYFFNVKQQARKIKWGIAQGIVVVDNDIVKINSLSTLANYFSKLTRITSENGHAKSQKRRTWLRKGI
jgi:membrane protease subunit (stomatin/prohibitin family)